MQCVTPMFRRYEVGNYKKGKVISRAEVMEDLDYNPNIIRLYLDKYNKRIDGRYKAETIPCRHCWACNLNYSAGWATRILYECKQYEQNYFITLTYNDKYLPIAEKIEYKNQTWYNDGSEKWYEGTVWRKHVDEFMHDLRQYIKSEYDHDGIKFYYCAEYGESTHRPHYHLILMNCPLDLSQFYKWHVDKNHKLHWKSKEIEKCWGTYLRDENGKMIRDEKDKPIFEQYGMIDVAEVEWSCCAYVARYCMKKLHTKNDEEYCIEGKLPEFVSMSKGIGKTFYNEHKHEIYKNDELILKTVKGNTARLKPPKAWDKKFKEEFPDQWEKIKKSRMKAAERSRKLKNEMSDYTDKEKLLIATRNVITKGKMLNREMEDFSKTHPS